jgi:hypothetical protein
MTESCTIEQDLCPVTVGDTVPFDFEFTFPDGTPINISGQKLTFMVSVNPDYDPITITQETIFPAGSNDGLGSMKVLPETTSKLMRGGCYFFKFVLTDGPSDIFTVGSGKWKAE